MPALSVIQVKPTIFPPLFPWSKVLYSGVLYLSGVLYIALLDKPWHLVSMRRNQLGIIGPTDLRL